MPLNLSTVICGYNQGRFAAEAIRSVLSQRPAPVEVIFVDNGSTDETRGEVETRHPSVRYVRQENLGPSGARNRGLAEARGDFVHFIDADDYILPGMYEAASQVLDRTPEIDVLVGGEFDVLPDGSIPREKDAPPGLDDAASALFADHPWCLHAALVRKSQAAKIGGFKLELWRAEDWDFWLRLALGNARFSAFPGRHAAYRRVPGSNSASYIAVHKSMREVLHAGLRESREPRHRRLVKDCLRRCGESLWYSHVRPAVERDCAAGKWASLISFSGKAVRTDPGNLPRIAKHVTAQMRHRLRKRIFGA